MISNKLKTVEVITPSGTKHITFRPVEIANSEEDLKCLCDTSCPYGKVCMYLPDPRQPEDPSYKFCDLCDDLGNTPEENGENNNIKDMVPCDGEIENNFKDIPGVMEILLEKNPLFHLNYIIDNVCPDFCDSYDKEHSQCSKDNSLCILRGLFRGPRKTDKSSNTYDMEDETRDKIQKEIEEEADRRREIFRKELENSRD